MITLTVLICSIALGIGAWRSARWAWTRAHDGGIWSMAYPIALYRWRHRPWWQRIWSNPWKESAR